MATSAPPPSNTTPIATGCSGIINGYAYSLSPNFHGSYTLNSTLVNQSAGPSCSVIAYPDLVYAACTVSTSPAAIIVVGTSSYGAAAGIIQIPTTGNCKPSHLEYFTGISQPLSVVSAPCPSQSSTTPCYAVLGTSTDQQYKILYAPSASFNSGNTTVTLPSTTESNLSPLLALQPNDISKLYVIGYPSRDQVIVKSNSYQDASQPYLKGTETMGGTDVPIVSQIPLVTATPSSVLQRRAPSTGSDMTFKLESAIQNTGPAVTVGGNIIVASAHSLSVEMIPAVMTVSSNTLPVTTVDLRSSTSQVHSSGSIVGIDSLTPGDSSTVWINYVDSQGNHLMASTLQPSLFAPASSSSVPTITTVPALTESAPSEFLSTGAIAGIAVGCVIGGLGFLLLAFCVWRRRAPLHQQKHPADDIALADQGFMNEKFVSTPTTYCSIPIKDDLVSSEPPLLASLTRTINNTPTEDYYDPTTLQDTLLLDSFAYSLDPGPPVYAAFPPGYATRSATRTHNTMPHHHPVTACTIHYFTFTSTVWVTQLLQAMTQLQTPLITYDAVRLATPTTHGEYQYLWITSPFDLHHTLHHLIFKDSTVVDHTQFSFKAWSTLSMLKAVAAVHEQGWIHGKINPSVFYYDQASTITDWHLTGFYQTSWAERLVDEYSAPESTYGVAMDIWSLGCVIYTVATGKRPFTTIDQCRSLLLAGHLDTFLHDLINQAAQVDPSFGPLLHRMLVIDPDARAPLPKLVHDWIQANELDDDED